MRVLRIHAAAAEEAAEAAAWYEKERPGLGADFERAIDAALDLLEQDNVPLTPAPGVAGARGTSPALPHCGIISGICRVVRKLERASAPCRRGACLLGERRDNGWPCAAHSSSATGR